MYSKFVVKIVLYYETVDRPMNRECGSDMNYIHKNFMLNGKTAQTLKTYNKYLL